MNWGRVVDAVCRFPVKSKTIRKSAEFKFLYLIFQALLAALTGLESPFRFGHSLQARTGGKVLCFVVQSMFCGVLCVQWLQRCHSVVRLTARLWFERSPRNKRRRAAVAVEHSPRLYCGQSLQIRVDFTRALGILALFLYQGCTHLTLQASDGTRS